MTLLALKLQNCVYAVNRLEQVGLVVEELEIGADDESPLILVTPARLVSQPLVGTHVVTVRLEGRTELRAEARLFNCIVQWRLN